MVAHRLRSVALIGAVTAAVLLAGCHFQTKAPVRADPIIALLSDHGTSDVFVAEIKGIILTANSRVRLLDITHEVEPFNLLEGAYLLSRAARQFPEGTIFLALVDPGATAARAPILVQTLAKKYYIAPNNGLLTIVIEREGFANAWKLDRPGYHRQGGHSTADLGRDIFGPAAAHLANGVSAGSLGGALQRKELTVLAHRAATVSGTNLTGEIWHVDRYGTLITNIPASLEPNLKQGVLLRVTLGNKAPFSAPLVKTLAEVPKGRAAILIGRQDFLEIYPNQAFGAKQVTASASTPILIQR